MNTKPAPPQVEAFEVGWISAVEVEYVAACELLDVEYADFHSRQQQDDNLYTMGKIGEHNVVLACLPKGEYGIASAASVVRDMMRTFPAIRIGLMVGIAGGAPSKKHDIRLGDVVVGIPDKQAGGVVQYDHGKAMQDGSFERTGSLDSPPRFLRNAVQKLQMIYKRKGHHINEIVQTIEKNKRLKKKYQRPATEQDILFETSSVHSDTKQSCEDLKCSETCRQVNREPRLEDDENPAIHYGLIASADTLMKDAKRRDDFAKEEGILCFEMEAAGIMNSFPCLVIRGICDYSDTHKNDLWQGYAAAVAAAYAKELLSVIPPQDVSKEDSAQSKTDLTSSSSQQPPQSGSNVTFNNHGPVGNQAGTQNIGGNLNNFSGQFTSKGGMYVGSTFDTKGGSMNFG